MLFFPTDVNDTKMTLEYLALRRDALIFAGEFVIDTLQISSDTLDNINATCVGCVPSNNGLTLNVNFTQVGDICRLITAYLLLRVNLDKIMHACWDFDALSARTRRMSALDKHQNWSASALFCLNSRAQSKYAVVNLIHTQRKQTFLSFIMW